MPHKTLFLDPGDETHVGIMLPTGKIVEVKLTCEDRGDAPPRLVIRVDGEDHHHVALQFDETVTWSASM
ncbi:MULTISPECIES: hypothetical protein [unclassified Mycobacterium]|uniref:hypothetical protein n=1 Tax=unclassified Mycobacterium TaxID=2642494 RepID=UPI0029C7E9E9|nr:MULTISPECIES: hypothetical protein [unclassified Mycobacterium]